MKDFLKKNIVLFAILAISLLFFLALALLAFMEWSKVKGYQASLQELHAKIQKLNEEKPHPVKQNLENIKKDTEILSRRTAEINRLFGKPYATALNAFIKSLCKDEKAEAKFLPEWNDYFKKNFNKNEYPEKLLRDFLAKRNSEEEIQKAKKAFAEIARTRTVEPMDDSNLNAMILDALSVPRSLNPDACKVYAQNMEENLFRFAAESTQSGNAITTDRKSKIFKVYEDADKLPPADFIPYIIKHYKLIEDLLYRMKASGIDNIRDLKKLNGLEGNRDGQYLIFTYQADLTASADAIRKLFDNLMKANEDNRIYVIRSVSIAKTFDEVKNVAATATTASTPPNSRRTETKTADTPAVKILGTNDKLNVEIKFSYIIYVGDEHKLR